MAKKKAQTAKAAAGRAAPPPAAEPAGGARRVNERYARPLFILTIVTGSFLLFLTQPMIARMALPRVGGSPSVWNSAMLVYQLLLLAGYAYAHGLSYLRPRLQSGIHLSVFAVAALFLPIGLIAAVPPADGQLAFWVPWFLISSIGLLFFVVSAQAPLMQRWYALETSRGDPYPLYAASNLGSFAGLISYPLIVEPLMSLHQQSWLWTAMYALLVLLVAACALTVPAQAVEELPEETAPPPTLRRMLHWIALAAVPSGLMLSTTTHLTTDIVAVPMLWVLPLGLYLLSFVIAFAHRRGPANLITMLAPLVILIAGGLVFSPGAGNPLYLMSLGLLLLFAIAVALHDALFQLRPAVGHLTHFYLAMSLGGMVGGLFCAIVAPLLFDWAYEHPLLILAAAFLVPQTALVPWPKAHAFLLALALPTAASLLSYAVYLLHHMERPVSALWTTGGSILISLIALACLGRRWCFAVTLAALMLSYGGWDQLDTSFEGGRTRSYFGIYEVREGIDPNSGEPVRILTHGTTIHGKQNLNRGSETVPTTYYAHLSGVGLVLDNAEALFGAQPRIGVVGLGSGTLSCYAAGHPNRKFLFFEIDRAMEDVALRRFDFLRLCRPTPLVPGRLIEFGDARLSIDRMAPASLDILAVDAFSSDSVPMHLLTAEALRTYGRALNPDGIVLFHTSNRYLQLEPVVAELAAREGWTARIMYYDPAPEETQLAATVSVWIALSRNPATIEAMTTMSHRMLARLETEGWNRLRALRDQGRITVAEYDARRAETRRSRWQAVGRQPGFSGWTDDHASILPIINFGSLLRFGM